MAKKMKMTTEHLRPVVCRNPETGQLIPTTIKVFESIYIDKGFELVDRDNADNGVHRSAAPNKKTAKEPASVQTGSAASIAATLGIGSDTGSAADTTTKTANVEGDAAGGTKAPRVQGEPRRDITTPADNAGTDVVDETENGNETDIDGATVTPEREPTKRDRGRG